MSAQIGHFENAPMLASARKAGASVQRKGGESEAHVVLPTADQYAHHRLRPWRWRGLARQRAVVS